MEEICLGYRPSNAQVLVATFLSARRPNQNFLIAKFEVKRRVIKDQS